MTRNSVSFITGVMALAFVMIAASAAYAADRYLDTSASAGLQGTTTPKWTNMIWSADTGGTNLTNIASNDNVFVQVETGKELLTLSIPANTTNVVNNFTIGNTNAATIGGSAFTFNVAGNITVRECSYLRWNGGSVFAFKPSATTVLTLEGSCTNVYEAGASAKGYTMGSLVFSGGLNTLAFVGSQRLTFGNLSGSSISDIIDLGNSSGANLEIDSVGNCAFLGTVTGAGRITQKGAGAFTLTGANTYSGLTTLSAGTLVVSNQFALQQSTFEKTGGNLRFGDGIREFTFGGLSGNGSFGLTNYSGAITLKVGSNNANTSYTGAMSGPGSLIKVGRGTLTTTANQLYTGSTTIQSGTLDFQSRLRTGDYYASITNNGTLLWEATTDQNLRGAISGSGTLIKNAGATLALWDVNTYSGPTIVSNGTLTIKSSLSLSTNTDLTVVSGAFVNLNATSQTCVSVGGSGAVNNGTLTVRSTLYPGGSNVVGTLTVSNLIVSAGAAVYWDYGAGGTDTNKVLGAATLSTNATVYVSGSGTLPTRAVLFDCGSLAAPSGVAGWSVVGALPNSRVSIQGNQLLLLASSGTLIRVL